MRESEITTYFFASILLMVFILVIIILSVTLYKGKSKRAKLEYRNNELEQANKLLKANQLKFQLKPHTLTNILSTLNILSARLNNGMASLSEILKYIIYKGESNLVSVEDEIDFMRKYITLNEQFTDEIDSMGLDDSKVDKTAIHYKQPSVPHLISAHFVENAFKHGDKSNPEFLRIKVHLKENEFILMVTNRIKIKADTSKHGIGLKNMHDRMEVLFPGRYEIAQSCNQEYYVSKLKITL